MNMLKHSLVAYLTLIGLINPIPQRFYELADQFDLTEKDKVLIVQIIQCESNWKNNLINDNGELGKDYGYWQINDHYNGKEIDSLGLDYKNNPDDNLIAGFYLYKKYGSRLWSCFTHNLLQH